LEPKPLEMLHAMPTKSAPQSSNAPKEKPEPYRERLKRFDTFRSHVLLKDGEAMEKQRLLAHVKTIQWIESQLTASPDNGMEALGERLSMIDFFEEALAWKDNPARNDALDSMDRTLKANNLAHGSKETKQMLAGDKVELFAILAEQAPNRAKELLERTLDKQLLSVFQYAVKRLALKKLTGEGL
jgi:ribosomal protein L30E